MAEVSEALRRGDLSFLDGEALTAFVTGQRWFGSKASELTHLDVLDAIPLSLDPPLFAAALVDARFAPGTREAYQLMLGLRPADEGWSEAVIAQANGFTVYDGLADPRLAAQLLDLMSSGATVEAKEAVVDFHWAEGFPRPGPDAGIVRPIGADQSNSSVVFDDALVLKAYRRVEAGTNPELELLRFLSERGFPSIAPLAGWYEYSGRMTEATLGVLQEFIPSGRDGWELALEHLSEDPESFLEPVRDIGVVTGQMHAVLGSEHADPTFAPEEPTAESLGLLTATVDDEIERVFFELPDDDEVAPIAGRGPEVRDKLRLLTHFGGAGKVIRTHGDYHLGQLLLADRGWIVLDFEGEPARSPPERRRKRSPLRDVAAMMRSFAYAASACDLRGAPVPEGWEERARERFLEGYFEHVDSSLLPSAQAFDQLLSVFEIEKAVYELRYEMNNRPDWLRVPVAGILRVLEESAA